MQYHTFINTKYMHGMIIFDSNVFRLRRNFINFASKSAISLKDPKPR